MVETLLWEQTKGVLTITLNRPEKKNALSSDMYRVLAEQLARADEDPDIRVVLVQGAGDSFTAGNELAEFAAVSRGEGPNEAAAMPLLRALATARKPLVAAVHGRAVGVGVTMLLHFDLVFVAEDALLSCPFVDLAVVPEASSTLLLQARIGYARAFEFVALGQPIDGRTARAWGLANAALPASEVHAEARAKALALAARAPTALKLTKGLMRNPEMMLARIDQEMDHFRAQLMSSEGKEVFAALSEKRPPDFSRL